MTNRILRTIRGEDEAELETLFSRQGSTLPLEGGRFGNQTPTRLITGGASYPKLPKSYSWQDHPELPDPFTDKVDQVTSMKFGMDLTILSGEPAKLPVSPPPKLDEKALPNQQPSRSFSRRSV
jgi:hypothetical protein